MGKKFIPLFPKYLNQGSRGPAVSILKFLFARTISGTVTNFNDVYGEELAEIIKNF